MYNKLNKLSKYGRSSFAIFKRINKYKQRIICILAIVCLVITSIPISLSADIINNNDTTEMKEQNLTLYPKKDNKKQKVKLCGMMPEGVTAEAEDVTKNVTKKHKAIAAYDITINDGEDEYQPGKKNPIKVEISNPVISKTDNIEIWHIKHNGKREKITKFSRNKNSVSFYATGFSVYEIVEASGEMTDAQINDVNELTTQKGMDSGFYLSYGTPKKYFTYNVLVNGDNSVLEESTDIEAAAIWFFEKSGNYYKIYTYVNNEKKYIHTKSGNNIELSDTADLIDISDVSGSNPKSFYFKYSSSNKWLQHSGSGGGIRYYNKNNDAVNPKIFIDYANPEMTPETLEQLDGKVVGLFHYSNGATKGNALMADSASHSLIKLLLTAKDNGRVLYVDEDNEIDKWKFTYNSSDNTFYISTENENGIEYLCADSNGISTSNSISTASKFNVQMDSSGRLRIKSNNVYIVYQAEYEEDGGGSFSVTTNGSKPEVWLYMLDNADMDDEDLITFSADRVSVSDIEDGQKVIVYLRIWNERDLRYDMYAIDHNGSLYPCYASGGKILWLGDGTGSIEWDFKEYVDPVTKQPNYYYELYNSYSEKYIAPQITGNQVLSEDPIGINMPGRRNSEFYSSVIAWDNARYAYIGVRPNADNTALEPCSESAAFPLYFATREELNMTDKLHEVPTIDNNLHGIKMRMVNFDVKSGKTYGGSDSADVTWNYLGGSTGIDKLTAGLLGNHLKENGYPDATYADSTYKDFGKAFENSIPVNHLFLDKVHESSGYFEFDSCQNYATLKKDNGDGTYSFNNNENGETDFTLYRELGTHDRNKTANSLKHGQFFPYDTIKPGVYAQFNSKNLYSSLTSPSDPTIGKLPEDDPRKYEPLHLIQSEKSNADFYFGMEMEASFVQTPSGLDAWGHDIVFEFRGDDDFWFYVDDELVLDLGGTHSALMGKIDFRTGKVTYDLPGNKVHGAMGETTLRQLFENNYRQRNPNATNSEVEEYLSDYFAEGETVFKDYSTHKMKMFYLERGANASNLYMRFNLAAVTPGHVVVSKKVSGDGADSIDTDFVEYPFQIYYTLPDGPNGEPGEEHLLGNHDENIAVTYQNSNRPVSFVRKYRPPGFTEEEAYENIYFINPSKSAEIAFPDDTITYRIVECAVDSSVYGNVTINGENVPPDRVEIKGDLRSYSSSIGSAEDRPNIAFDNFVNDNVIKDLYITKKLLDENNNEILDDPTTFNFRLYISSVDVNANEIPPTNMYHYFVLSSDKKMCRFDEKTQKFVKTNITYSQKTARDLRNGQIIGYSVDDLTFTTSGFGAISGIPSNYTICVPGLPVGSIFKVTEDVKPGYGLMGYNRVMGTKINDDYTEEDIPSYWEYEGNPLNVGKVRAEENPQMEVLNKKGYSINVNKQWSDTNLTTGHAPVYVAVYVDGQLLENSVKQILSPANSTYYFWTTLMPKANGEERININDYVVKEVSISNPLPSVGIDGSVSNYGLVTPLEDGDSINIVATRTQASTPEGEDRDKAYDYIVSSEMGLSDGTTRTDTITNTRNGGIALRLFKWETDNKLKGGKFQLFDEAGNTVGEYISGSDGIINMMYNFERNKVYTLKQITAPRGYVGLQKNLKFVVNDDDSVSLLYNDGITPWGNVDATDRKWANYKVGEKGIIAFIDIYNKPFNFKIEKMDSEDSSIMLEDAHFALYKQANTSISGYVKNKEPMTGFEDMVTENGVVDICGGNSGRVINPGDKGSVYFLTEIRAPFNYSKLTDDIIFRVSPIGVPTLISDSYNGTLVETEDSYIYTLSVPNVIKQPDIKVLTIEKKVDGTGGDREKQFKFNIAIEGAGSGENFAWSKNGIEQTPMSRTGGSVWLKHNDKVEIALPEGVTVTVTELNELYTSSFKLDDGAVENVTEKSFVVNDDTKLCVTNTLDLVVPTGAKIFLLFTIVALIIALVTVAVTYKKRKVKR